MVHQPKQPADLPEEGGGVQHLSPDEMAALRLGQQRQKSLATAQAVLLSMHPYLKDDADKLRRVRLQVPRLLAFQGEVMHVDDQVLAAFQSMDDAGRCKLLRNLHSVPEPAQLARMLEYASSPVVAELIARMCLSQSEGWNASIARRCVAATVPGSTAQRLLLCLTAQQPDATLEDLAQAFDANPEDQRTLMTVFPIVSRLPAADQEAFARMLRAPTARATSAMFFVSLFQDLPSTDILQRYEQWKVRGSMRPGMVHAALSTLAKRSDVTTGQLFQCLGQSAPDDHYLAAFSTPERVRDLQILRGGL